MRMILVEKIWSSTIEVLEELSEQEVKGLSGDCTAASGAVGRQQAAESAADTSSAPVAAERRLIAVLHTAPDEPNGFDSDIDFDVLRQRAQAMGSQTRPEGIPDSVVEQHQMVDDPCESSDREGRSS